MKITKKGNGYEVCADEGYKFMILVNGVVDPSFGIRTKRRQKTANVNDLFELPENEARELYEDWVKSNTIIDSISDDNYYMP